jgi:peptidoglycan hydrolase-like protein with peptidoglycan-binding domain
MSIDHLSAGRDADRTSPGGHGSLAGVGAPDGPGDGAPGGPATRRGPRRPRGGRRLVVLGVPAVAVAVAAVVATRGDGDGGDDATGGATTTVPVEVRDLVRTDEYTGELGYGEASPALAGRSGVVTGVAEAGTTVGQGEALFDLDLQPTVLLHGDIPAFRDMSVDADPGSDIAQLEEALHALGHGDGVTVDGDFTEATAAAVEDWEEALGRSDPDGVVSLGDVLFAPGDLRVDEVSADVGTQVQSGSDVVQVTATTKVVTLQVTVDEAADLEPGIPVTIELPDGAEATGTIADVATEPTSADDGGAGGGQPGDDDQSDEETFAVVVALDDPTTAAAFDSGGVAVSVESSRTEGATAVPVTALLALAEGGYAVQVVDDARAEGYRLVAVEVGTMADEWVQITGDGIEPGVEVVVPA